MGKTLNRLTKHPLPDFVGRRLDVVVGVAVVLAVVEVVMLLVPAVDDVGCRQMMRAADDVAP